MYRKYTLSSVNKFTVRLSTVGPKKSTREQTHFQHVIYKLLDFLYVGYIKEVVQFHLYIQKCSLFWKKSSYGGVKKTLKPEERHS
jgi:hypothetical protein